MTRVLFWFYSVFFTIPALAEAPSSQTPSEASNTMAAPAAISQPVSSSSIMELTLGLIFVILLIFVIAWFIKRFSIFHPVASDQLKVVAGIHLGQREKIILVQVGEEQILVGLTATDIRTLHVLETPLAVQDNKSAMNSEFAKRLAGLMDNFKGKS